MNKFLTLDPTTIQSGLFSGVGKAAAPVWTEGENMAFQDLGVRKIQGARAFGPIYPSPVRALEQGFASPERRVYVGTEQGLHVTREVAGIVTDQKVWDWITASSRLDLETWGTFLLASNGIDPVVVWKNAGQAAPLAGVTFSFAKKLFRYNPYILAFSTSMGDTAVEWCSDDNIEDWTPTTTNTAGNFTIRDLDSEIVAVEPLGDKIGVYSQATLALGTYIGTPDIFGFRAAIKGIGAISPRSVVAQGVYNYGLTQNGIFVTDGASSTYIDDPAMVRWLRNTVDWERTQYIWGFHDDILRAITWTFLNREGGFRSVSYHYDLKVFTRGNLQSRAGMARNIFASPLIVDSTNRVCLWQEGSRFGGQPVPFYLRSKPLDFGTREMQKILQLIRVDGEWGAGTTLRIGAQEDPEGEVDWFFSSPLQKRNYGIDREAPYFTIEFSGTSPFYITGIEFFGETGGLVL